MFAPGSHARVWWYCPHGARWRGSLPGGGGGGQLPASRGFRPRGRQRSCRPATRRLLASHPFLSPGPPREGRVSGPCPVCSIPCARVHRAEGTRCPDEVLPHRFLQPHYNNGGLHHRSQDLLQRHKSIENRVNFHVKRFCAKIERFSQGLRRGVGCGVGGRGDLIRPLRGHLPHRGKAFGHLAFPYGEGFERPENSPVESFQRERAGRPRRISAKTLAFLSKDG